MPQDLLITGFTPFDGRDVNGSWVAAQTYKAANHLEIPVVWGKPMGLLRETIDTFKPKTIISLGEGREGGFHIETKAQNIRKHRKDNNEEYPTAKILEAGPDFIQATIHAEKIRAEIAAQQIPIQISDDAGQFLCEETLYCLETLVQEANAVEKVTFTHLPPFGTQVEYRGEMRVVDEDLLEDFLQRLVKAVLNT